MCITLRDEVIYALEIQAQAMRRSFSATVELYVTSDVGLAPERRPGWEVGVEQADAIDRLAPGIAERGARGPMLAPPPDPRAPTRATPVRAKPPRNALCPHRIPPEMTCRVCDR